ncbi:cell division protein FtsQ/DivIB [Aliikangiella coralliicola]|uniref:FtsQ-type POTRA domain-containing protein n=1 Tax=Aliikangiella coralliicola TaxID=2592383 RepID=A0A545UK52_9GAMM|nr:cell division protein FtsQ/DivIB [Aliikangiella coralliicola]TQV89836.1 FtsQ-type POTRA domain-containing protein [Aliikangiella coralliicola]
MTKKKMAIKNKSKIKQFRFNFDGVQKAKSVGRILFAAASVVCIVFLGNKIVGVYEGVWPVREVVLENEPRYFQKNALIEFVRQQPVQGMLAIDLSEIQRQAKRLDWIKNIEVRKVWPDKLIFTVEEHQPVAMFDNQVLTQQGGMIKNDTRSSWSVELPQISLQHKDEEQAEKANDEKFYMAVWREYKQVKRQFELLNLETDLLQVDQLKNWQLSFTNGLQINLGRKEREERVARLLQVYGEIKDKQKIKKIDLRYLNGLAIEWKTET